jgi:hypothetical protein
LLARPGIGNAGARFVQRKTFLIDRVLGTVDVGLLLGLVRGERVLRGERRILRLVDSRLGSLERLPVFRLISGGGGGG